MDSKTNLPADPEPTVERLYRTIAALREELSEKVRAGAAVSARLRLSEFALGHSLHEVLTRTLDEAEVLTGSTIGFFHFVEADQKTLSLQTWSTNTLQKMCAAEEKGEHYAADKAGVWADALRDHRPVVHNDYPSLAHRKGLPAGHAPVLRELVVPILRNDQVMGLLGVGNAPRDYGQRDVECASLLANLAWDIVLIKRTEEALHRRQALLTQTQEFTHVGGWEYDVRSRRIDWTQEVRNIYEVGPEYEPNDLSRATSFYAQRERQVLEAAFQRALREGEPYDLELEFVGLRGTRKWVRTAGQVERVNGKIVRVFGSILDITEHRRLQVSLALNDRLAGMGMLAAGVGHEINNPLSYVLANVDTLAQELPKVAHVTARCLAALRSSAGEAAVVEAVGAEAESVSPLMLEDLVDCARTSLEGTRRIQAISRRLGAFSRVERDKLEAIDLNLTIESAVTMAHNEVKFRATLVKDLGVIPEVQASESKLSQLFLNLITNAAQAIGDGRVDQNRITVRTWAEGKSVFAEVGDSGPGIPAENLERIFEPFFSTKKFGAGSGLGLSISRNIANELGGDLRASSEVGKGARFLVRLPALETKAAAPVQPRVPDTSPRGRVLVVDDEVQIRKTLLRLLGRDHAVVAVASGREAVTLLERDAAFDLVLSDLMMPEMTGMQLHAWMVAQLPALAPRVVFVTGGGFTPEAEHYLANVSNLQVEKPFQQDALRKTVNGLIATAKAGR